MRRSILILDGGDYSNSYLVASQELEEYLRARMSCHDRGVTAAMYASRHAVHARLIPCLRNNNLKYNETVGILAIRQ